MFLDDVKVVKNATNYADIIAISSRWLLILRQNDKVLLPYPAQGVGRVVLVLG